MKEYLLYAILIFVPVGTLMEFFLRREGLVLKFRLILEVFSLAIIISFPVLINRLGMWYAVFIYLASIFALSWYFLRVSQGPSWYLRQSSSADSDEVFATERLIENNVVRTLGEIEDEMLLQKNLDITFLDIEAGNPVMPEGLPEETESTKTDNIHIPEPDSLESIAGESGTIMIHDGQELKENLASEPTQGDEAKESTGADETGVDEEASSAAADETNLNRKENAVQAEVEITAGNDNSADDLDEEQQLDIEHDFSEAAITEPLPAELNSEQVTSGQEMVQEASRNEEPTPDDNKNEKNDQSPAEKEMQSVKDQTESAAEPNLTEEVPAAIMIDQSETNEKAILLDQLAAEPNLDALIENGFTSKQAQRYLEAIQFFNAAAEIAADEELKYLLTMEMVELLKEAGSYVQAEQVLFLSSIGKAYKRTDIIDKINRQLSYIRFLAVELDRLGLSNTPIADVPSEVKTSIAGMLEI